MDKEQFLALIQKYLSGGASLEDEQMLLNFYGSFQDTLLWDEEMMGVKEEIEGKILNRIQAYVMQKQPIKRSMKLWPQMAVAAAAIAAIVFGVWFFNSERRVPKQVQDDVAYKNDIAPGKNTATLTLASGKVIDLDTSRTSVVVADSVKAMTMLTAATPRGGTYQVVLPDGTNVWLNADSKISFPSQFNGKERKILLTGEAYFEVKKDRTRPFIVSTEKQEVTVLGTHFNINSYADETATRTTLLEGSVSVWASGHSEVIKPGEQSLLYDGAIKVQMANIDEVVAWKNGDFVFEDERINSIMRKLERWYNIEVAYEGKITEEGFYGQISRNKNISEVLALLEQSQGVHFEIKGRRVTVKQ